MTKIIAVSASVALTACAGSDGDTTCPPRDGVYLLDYDEVSGNCGELADSVERRDPDEVRVSEPGCMVLREEISEDGCTEEFETTCPDRSAPFPVTIRQVGTFTSEPDGSGIGVFELEYVEDRTGDPVCRSVYDVKVTKR